MSDANRIWSAPRVVPLATSADVRGAIQVTKINADYTYRGDVITGWWS